MSGRLEGKRVLLTGASRGLGRQLARAFWREGASLLLVARSAEQLRSLCEECGARNGQQVAYFPADLSEGDAPQRIVSQARARWDGLDVLVNNAAITGPIGRLWETDAAEWRATLQVNLFAPVELCRLCVPWMRAGGSILHLSGGGATGPRPRFTAYATAKAGLVRFSETLAEETKERGIRVNAVAPGAMNTEMLRDVLDAGPERAGAEYARAVEQSRKGGSSPDRAAELCVFLASEASEGITGKLLSAVWDPWQRLPEHRAELQSDIYTLRRIVPSDRGKDWA
jgi:NAD(P)-dependent dehydrogenase (short-subunit alcohol dehydrogenase family)